MPQMAPMSWTMLFFFFSIMLIFMATLNYYLYIPNSMKTEDNLFKMKMLPWKW